MRDVASELYGKNTMTTRLQSLPKIILISFGLVLILFYTDIFAGPLYVAAGGGNAFAVQSLLEAGGIDVNQSDFGTA